MTTIAQIAAETNSQPHEIAALLDLGVDYTDNMELEPWMIEVILEATAAASDR